MSGFSIRNPYFIIVVCLMIAVVGTVSLVRLPVDMFPTINIPVAVVATFYNGMPPEQIEADITGRYERFFTLASNVEHIESMTVNGLAVVKVFLQANASVDTATAQVTGASQTIPTAWSCRFSVWRFAECFPNGWASTAWPPGTAKSCWDCCRN